MDLVIVFIIETLRGVSFFFYGKEECHLYKYLGGLFINLKKDWFNLPQFFFIILDLNCCDVKYWGKYSIKPMNYIFLSHKCGCYMCDSYVSGI